MNAGQVIELAREWVELYGRHTPGFCGAYRAGSLNAMPSEALFPAYKDVDLHLVLKDAVPSDPTEVTYKGLILEYGQVSEERYQSPSAVLADPELAPNLAVPSILSDPTGRLAALQAVVSQEYRRRQWVSARCTVEQQGAWQALATMSQARSLPEAFFAQGFWLVGLTGCVAVANLKPPTHRRCLILMQSLLEQHGRAELHEEILDLLGYGHLTCAQVAAYLHACTETFDRAVQVTRTPVPFGFKLRAHVRPYIIEAAQEMIDEGHHREAMFWIGGFLVIANAAIQADATPDDKAYFQAKIDGLLNDLGFGALRTVAARTQCAQVITEELFKVAEEMVSCHADIVD